MACNPKRQLDFPEPRNPTMPIRIHLVATSLLGLVLATSAAHAAAIAGRVNDANTKSTVLGATVTVRELERSTTTSAGGDYYLGNLPDGTYTLVTSYLGYQDTVQTVTVSGSGETRADVSIGSEVVQLGSFMVEGTREGQARALQLKRSSNNIMDAVAADAVGKFPDGNAAEALRRVPGVSLEIDQSEGRFVVIRGVDASLNNVTLNGQNVGSPAEQGRRGLAMDSVPADLIARLEVVKAVTPDLDHNAIGGSVNIVTQSAFDRPDGFLYGSVSGAYTNFNENWGWWAGSATFGRILDDAKKWGLVAGVSYSRREYASQTSDALAWVRNTTTGFYVPTTQESFDYNIERQRLGINAALEFRPREGHQLFARVNLNEFTDEEGRQKTGFEFARGTLSNVTATSGNYSQGRSTKEFRDYKQNHAIQSFSVGGKHDLANEFKLDWQVGTSHAERITPRRVDWEFRSAANAFANSYNLAGEIPIITPDASFYNPVNFPFRRVRFRRDDEQEDVYSGQVDLQRQLQFGNKPGSIKFGAKVVNSDKTQDRSNINYNLQGTAFTLAEPGLAGPEPSNFMDGRYRMGPTISLQNLQAFYAANPSRFVYDAIVSQDNSLSADYDANERVYSGYGMATIDVTKQFSILGGLRVERTEAEYSANELIYRAGTFTGAYNRINRDQHYTEVLPGVHLNWRPTSRLVARAAWTNTYGRTNYTDLAPRNVLDDTDLGGGVFQGSLTAGNPDLKPFESMNFDASLEYYLKNAGVVSVGLFHKRIDNPVYRRSVTLTNTTYNGRNYAQLSVTRPENAQRGEITGVELNWQQFFNFLPAPFDGFGVNVNYTITDSSAHLIDRKDEVRFFKQADAIGNLALVYEKYGIEARLAYALTGDYLEAVGASPDLDEYTDRRRVLDAKLSYRFHPKARVFVEFLNLNEEPLRAYIGEPRRSGGFEIYSWNANVGINWNL